MSELNEMLESLPVEACNDREPTWPCNAWVHIDDFGRLSILFKEGGWLGVKKEDLQRLEADIAPFHG